MKSLSPQNRRDKILISLVQMTSTDSVENNFQQIKTLLSKSPEAFPAHLIVFPENSLFMKVKRGGGIADIGLKDPVFLKLRELCERHKTCFLLTSPLQDRGKMFNAVIFLSAGAGPKVLYRKIHLFDTSLENGRALRESRLFSPGPSPAIWNFQGWRFGLSICYDLRFAELYAFYARRKADILLIPSAFLRTTGEKHWQVLLRARAIESQCYVLAPAQCGRHKSSETREERHTHGHSLAVSPDGEVLRDMGRKSPCLQTFCFSKQELKKVREPLPQARHRRLKFFLQKNTVSSNRKDL